MSVAARRRRASRFTWNWRITQLGLLDRSSLPGCRCFRPSRQLGIYSDVDGITIYNVTQDSAQGIFLTMQLRRRKTSFSKYQPDCPNPMFSFWITDGTHPLPNQSFLKRYLIASCHWCPSFTSPFFLHRWGSSTCYALWISSSTNSKFVPVRRKLNSEYFSSLPRRYFKPESTSSKACRSIVSPVH